MDRTITKEQVAMLIKRMVKLGLREEAEQVDFLLECGVYVESFEEITQQDYHREVIPALVQAEAEAEVNA